MFRKTAQNNKLCLYLGNRDVVVSNNSSSKIHGIVLVDPDLLKDTKKKVWLSYIKYIIYTQVIFLNLTCFYLIKEKIIMHIEYYVLK